MPNQNDVPRRFWQLRYRIIAIGHRVQIPTYFVFLVFAQAFRTSAKNVILLKKQHLSTLVICLHTHPNRRPICPIDYHRFRPTSNT